MSIIAILGGGASGMAAALAARERLDNRVLVLERQNRVGRKLLATGNGRCNLTNENACSARYHGTDPAFAEPALGRFGVQETLQRFRSLGLLTRTEPGGRVYPLSDSAGSVVDALRLAMDARGVETICSFEAAGARVQDGRFLVTSSDGKSIECDRLIIACGGMAGARLGGTDSGYALLHSFGHNRTALRPSLVQLKTENTWTRPMKGVRTQAGLTLEQGSSILSDAFGEVQFTDYGVTGPAIFDLSRAASSASSGAVVVLRLLPELEAVDIMNYLNDRRNCFPNYKLENLLTGTLHNTIARTLIRRAGLSLDAALYSLSDDAINRVFRLLCRFELPLMGTLGFSDAQVTAGGVETAGFDPETMESRLVPGLYACGEVLDIDGDCGGFNLQWAWSSGTLAGLSAAGLLREETV